MKYSKNYEFNLPTAEDNTLADIGVISQNFEKVDEVMKKNENLGVELNRFKADTITAVGRLNTKDADLQSQIDALGDADLSELETDIETLKTNVSNLQSADATVMDRLGGLMTADENLQSQIDTLESDIVDLQAQTLQQTPLFADSIEECTDTSKLYVLPDGYIYAYMDYKGTREIIEQITSGFLDNSRLSTNAGEVSTMSGMVTTPYIDVSTERFPLGTAFKVRFTGAQWAYDMAGTNKSGYAHALYNDTEFVYAHYTNGKNSDVYEPNNYKLNIISETEVEFSPYDVNAARSYNQIRFSGLGTSSNAIVQIVYEETVSGYDWTNTGHAFVPADYEDRIIDLEEETAENAKRLAQLEANAETSGIPYYWLEEIAAKADTMQRAVETAGRNKSAFLWYTDAHWKTNSKVSPALLKYFSENTPINKVNFGGDIINDPSPFTHENIKYAYEWRKLIAGLPNHHSVYGNHDVNAASFTERKMAYSYILAPEESADMVVGGESYYYIDNPSEKTRYLYLSFYTMSSAFSSDLWAQGRFIVNAISSVAEGWHIVVIAHRWFQYEHSYAPTVGVVPAYEAEILQVFDEYNARGTHATVNYFDPQDFRNAKGKVEFCIGGHIHVDYDFTTSGGIPVIITASDTNQDRSAEETEDNGVIGTITESAVFGVIANYDNNKITIVGVGRGTSREISY